MGMIRRPTILFLLTASIGAVAAGCGSSSSSSTSSSTPASSTTSAATTTTSAASTPASVSSNPAVVQAVAACKAGINSQSRLTASVKAKLTSLCDKAASGDAAGARKVSAQVCQEIIKATVPVQAQTQALATCPKG